MLNRNLITAFYIVFGLATLQAQESINVSGGDASGKNGQVNYSVGQVLFTTDENSKESVAKGVQQAFEISVVDGENIDISCEAYPNPIVDILKLRVNNFQFFKLYYHLFDITGRLIESKELIEKETIIQMRTLPPATYFLRVADNKSTIKTFKITKR